MAELTQDENDVAQLHPMISATEKSLRDAGVKAPIGAVVVGAGYMSDQNLNVHDPDGPELFATTTKSHTQRTAAKERGAPLGRIPWSRAPGAAEGR